MVMGLYTGELIFGGGLYSNGLSFGEIVGLYLGGGLIFRGGEGACNRRFITVQFLVLTTSPATVYL